MVIFTNITEFSSEGIDLYKTNQSRVAIFGVERVLKYFKNTNCINGKRQRHDYDMITTWLRHDYDPQQNTFVTIRHLFL
jgi:hypothetical protein